MHYPQIRQWFCTAISLMLAVMLFTSCDNSSAPSQVTTVRKETTTVTTTTKKDACSSTWPYICEGQDSEEVQDDDQFRKTYLVVIDGSGSMKETSCAGGERRIDVAKRTIKKWAATMVNDESYLGMIAFDSRGITVRVAFGYGEANRAAFNQQVDAVGADSSTPLWAATKLAKEVMTKHARLQLGRAEWHIIFLTDGEYTQGPDPIDEVNYIVDKTDISLHVIGFCIPPKHSMNQAGRTNYLPADSPQALEEAFRKTVVAESGSK